MIPGGPAPAARMPRPPAVAGLFYDDDPGRLGRFVDELLGNAPAAFPPSGAIADAPLAGILVPHAGLVYSGLVAATAWRLLPAATGGGGAAGAAAPTVVLLGTNHGAGWLTGVGAWDGGPWRTPLGDVKVDDELVGAVLAVGGPFEADRECHLVEHSLEVQLPFLRRVAPGARIVPLAVGTGTGARAIEAGERLGRLLTARRAAGDHIVLAISTDMAHYPRAEVAERITAALLPPIVARDPAGLAAGEARARRSEPRTSCGMCGIEPAVLGLAALRAMGAGEGVPLAAATSADAGGDPGRTVGYLAVAYPAG
jgi:MEMO1 family protein